MQNGKKCKNELVRIIYFKIILLERQGEVHDFKEDPTAGDAIGSSLNICVISYLWAQRSRRSGTICFGCRSRVKTPFLLPSTRISVGAVAKSAMFHRCSPIK